MTNSTRKYKGYSIRKVLMWGCTYYQINGEKEYYTKLKEAKENIDRR